MFGIIKTIAKAAAKTALTAIKVKAFLKRTEAKIFIFKPSEIQRFCEAAREYGSSLRESLSKSQVPVGSWRRAIPWIPCWVAQAVLSIGDAANMVFNQRRIDWIGLRDLFTHGVSTKAGGGAAYYPNVDVVVGVGPGTLEHEWAHQKQESLLAFENRSWRLLCELVANARTPPGIRWVSLSSYFPGWMPLVIPLALSGQNVYQPRVDMEIINSVMLTSKMEGLVVQAVDIVAFFIGPDKARGLAAAYCEAMTI